MSKFLHDLGDIAELSDSRRTALRRISELGAAAAIASIPFIKPGAAKAQSTGGDLGILNFALTLEYLERSFYRQAAASGFIPTEATPLFDLIQLDEERHVSLLRQSIIAVGGDPVDYTDSDFTFDGFLGDFASIATLAQGLEDTGVRAYKGQAAAIEDKAYLTVALQIHSVEARHAAAIRSLAASPATDGWIPLDEPTAAGTPIEATYAGEANTTQGGVELVSALGGAYTAEQVSEAFDETLTMDQVLAIAGGFITGEQGDGDD